ncbi:hypothetical protein BpHYR1_026134 [Brachionus plicatilis]|uniref:Uncharacterized protein n=1 Tax=Brachionus plicatilis TaxID=10195 RepID=A0A3M7T771_BRAPC|nr:hypothetical protein BpHYR1_026134 [Brachionus plicatilis]
MNSAKIILNITFETFEFYIILFFPYTKSNIRWISKLVNFLLITTNSTMYNNLFNNKYLLILLAATALHGQSAMMGSDTLHFLSCNDVNLKSIDSRQNNKQNKLIPDMN